MQERENHTRTYRGSRASSVGVVKLTELVQTILKATCVVLRPSGLMSYLFSTVL